MGGKSSVPSYQIPALRLPTVLYTLLVINKLMLSFLKRAWFALGSWLKRIALSKEPHSTDEVKFNRKQLP